MTGKWHGGKGDKPRPVKNKDKFDSEWDRIFKRPKDKKQNDKVR